MDLGHKHGMGTPRWVHRISVKHTKWANFMQSCQTIKTNHSLFCVVWAHSVATAVSISCLVCMLFLPGSLHSQGARRWLPELPTVLSVTLLIMSCQRPHSKCDLMGDGRHQVRRQPHITSLVLPNRLSSYSSKPGPTVSSRFLAALTATAPGYGLFSGRNAFKTSTILRSALAPLSACPSAIQGHVNRKHPQGLGASKHKHSSCSNNGNNCEGYEAQYWVHFYWP